MEEKKKAKIYTKWWFWVGIIAIIGILANLPYGNNQTYIAQESSNMVQPIEKNEPQETEEQRIQREKKAEEERIKKEKETIEEQKRKEKEEKKNFKDSCKSYTYKEIARNPDKYKGKNIKFTGKVIQVMEGMFNSVTLRIDMTKDEYGYYDDTIYATYTYSEGENKILEDDIVTVYGICQGTTSYESIFGATVTLPQIDIKYLTIKE